MQSFRTGFVFDERFLAHDTGVEDTVVTRNGAFRLTPTPHPSSTLITQRIKEFLDGCGLTALMQPIEARAATEDELATYHTRAYIVGIRELVSSARQVAGPLQAPWGSIDEETVLSPGSFEAALYAAGGAENAVSAVLTGRVRNAYVLLRPPGHHAMRNQALGFCLFNEAVIAAHHARNVYGLERIMIIDWDVHHGNGTQDAFYDDRGVLFLSLHQEHWFPGNTGGLEEIGSDAGTGYTVNIPLPPGTGDRGYRAALEQLVLPIGLQYRPQLIIVTAGHDASWLDPLAQMMVTMDGFRQLSQLMVDLAESVCAGRLVMLQAGGYSAPYVPYCAAATVEALVGTDLGIVDLYPTAPELARCQSIFSQDTQQALATARSWHRQRWKL
ncbi:MAG: class II histone deacetylase [Ktedonobacteraceae bacterium]|nr:class II histone deacetylase [Ktedonobacteraceae bacterium]